MKKSLFEKLTVQAEADVKLIDQIDEVMKKSLEQPTIVQKWARIWAEQKNVVERLKIEKDEMYGQKFKHYRFEDKKYIWSNDKQVDSQIGADEEYLTKCRELNEQKFYLDFVGQTLENVKSMAFTIQKYLDYKKMLKN